MPTIHLRVVPQKVQYSVWADYSRLEESWHSHGPLIVLKGKPESSGTYRGTTLQLRSGATALEVPREAIVQLWHHLPSDGESRADVYYTPVVPRDAELATNEIPPRLWIALYVGPTHFATIASFLSSNPAAHATAEVDFETPQVDASGYVGWWDVDRFGTSDKPIRASSYDVTVHTPNGQRTRLGRKKTAELPQAQSDEGRSPDALLTATSRLTLIAFAILVVAIATCYRV